jgi:hypothetical protein
MFTRADLTVKEVPSPANLCCRSGHVAPETFRREGMLGPDEPTKFFHVVSNQNPEINGVYCEPCLIIANAMSKNKMRIR